MNTSLIWLGRVVVLIIGLVLIGAIYESVAETADAKAYPPLVNWWMLVGINCTSTAQALAVQP
jgi:hypothetical protein